jgi:hypothetical protein
MADDQPAPPPATTEKSEPAISTGAVVTAGTMLVDGLILFGVQIGAEQKTYLLSVITLLAPIIASLIIRAKVWSPKSMMAIVDHYKTQLAAKEREADQASAQAAAAQAAVSAVRASVPAAVQGLIGRPPQQPPQRPAEPPRQPSAPETQRPVPDRVYGLYGGEEQPAGRINPPTRVQPAVPPTEPGPDADPGGFYRYSEEELAAPRGIRRPGPRHSMG